MDTFAYSRERPLSRWAEEILERSGARTHLELSLELLRELSDKEETSELLAVIEMRGNDPARIPLRPNALVVVADRPTSPGNLGSLIRSSDAFGADALVVTGHAADLYDPQTVRASVGSLFAIPCLALPSHRELLEWLDHARTRVEGIRLVGTSASAAIPLRQFDFTAPVVLLVGNETAGLSHAYRTACDAMVTIPMRGSPTSLNLAAAASIVLYEIDSQRHPR